MISGKDGLRLIEKLTRTVPGAITLNEAHFLYYLAKEGPRNGAIVEIGSFCGYSTIWLACGTKYAKREKVYAIDPQNSYMGRNEETFRENIKRAGVDDYIIPLIMTSREAAKEWGEKPIRLLFIDGNHEYEYVKEDFLLWETYLVEGGVIAFHDCFSVVWSDVLKCVEEDIFDSDKFGDLGVIDLTLYAVKKKDGLTILERMKKENFIRLLTPFQNLNHNAEKALISIQEGKFNKAEGELKEAERIIQVLGRTVSDFGKMMFNLHAGNFYLKQEKYKEAEARYNEALSLREIPPQIISHAILGLANCYSSQGKYKEAEEKFNEALSIEGVPDSEKIFAHYNLGSMYERKRDYIKARDKFETVLALGKEIDSSERKRVLGNTHFHLGCIYQALGERQKAKREFKNCLKLIPDHKKAKQNSKGLE